ncbi:13548_t:CDS:1 [Funneliformis geosporum]|uniref:Large ribosomal subunit protein bL27m n=1 Tax=Funneliformis geosporum TaxID=1117311 RepID=A0A9W4SB00_9GLOM|nr:13548_t:CDS:1 [Funneliformis geosporum]
MVIFQLDLQFFAQKKGGGSASTNRSHDSISKRLGVKKFGGEQVRGGNIIICQRGTKYKIKKSDESVFFGKTYNIHAKYDGVVSYYNQGGRKKRTFVTVLSKPNKEQEAQTIEE